MRANLTRSPATQTPARSESVAEGEDLGERVLGAGGMTQADVERVLGQRPHPHGVELLADAEVADPVAEPERERTRAGGEMEQVGRR